MTAQPPSVSSSSVSGALTSTPRFAVSIDQVGEQEWSGLLERFADANFYQTWAYGAVSWGDRQLDRCVTGFREAAPSAYLAIAAVSLSGGLDQTSSLSVRQPVTGPTLTPPLRFGRARLVGCPCDARPRGL